jgi:teichuronic acid biosynthesis protein TuaE
MRNIVCNKFKVFDLTVYLLIFSCFLGSISLASTPIGELVFVRLFLIICLIAYLYRILATKCFKSPFTIYCFPFLLLPLFGLVSLFWTAADIISAITYLLNLTTGCMIAYLIINYANNAMKLQRAWLLFSMGSLVQIIIACLEVATGWRTPVSRYIEGGEFADYVIARYRYTPTGLQGNENNFAFVIGIFFIYILFSNRRKTLIHYMTLIVVFSLIVLSGSRATIMGLTVGLVYVFILVKKSIKISFYILTIIKISTFILFLLMSYKFIFPVFDFDSILQIISRKDFNQLFNEILEANQNNDTSGGNRLNILLFALKGLAEERFFMGAGVGGSIALVASISKGNIWVSNMHNFWIELLVDFGIFPFLLLVLWSLWLFSSIYKLYQIKNLNSDLNNMLFFSQIILLYILFAGVSPSSLVTIWPFYAALGIISATLMVGKDTLKIHGV